MNAAARTVVTKAIEYAERRQVEADKEAAKGPTAYSWHRGRASAFEDVANLLRMGLEAMKEQP